MMLSTINGISFTSASTSKCNDGKCQRGNNSAAKIELSQADTYQKTGVLEKENQKLQESLRFACRVIAAQAQSQN